MGIDSKIFVELCLNICENNNIKEINFSDN